MSAPAALSWDERVREREQAMWKAKRARLSMLLDDTHAVMTRAEFEALDDYSATIPTGSFFGKIWRRGEPYRARSDAERTFYLGEYFDDGTPDMVAIKWRRILVVD